MQYKCSMLQRCSNSSLHLLAPMRSAISHSSKCFTHVWARMHAMSGWDSHAKGIQDASPGRMECKACMTTAQTASAASGHS